MNYIWLSEPLHKNNIGYEIEKDLIDSKKLMMTFDGSVVAFCETLLKDKDELVNEIESFKMGYNKDFKLPSKIEDYDQLLKVLVYLSE